MNFNQQGFANSFVNQPQRYAVGDIHNLELLPSNLLQGMLDPATVNNTIYAAQPVIITNTTPDTVPLFRPAIVGDTAISGFAYLQSVGTLLPGNTAPVLSAGQGIGVAKPGSGLMMVLPTDNTVTINTTALYLSLTPNANGTPFITATVGTNISMPRMTVFKISAMGVSVQVAAGVYSYLQNQRVGVFIL